MVQTEYFCSDEYFMYIDAALSEKENIFSISTKMKVWCRLNYSGFSVWFQVMKQTLVHILCNCGFGFTYMLPFKI